MTPSVDSRTSLFALQTGDAVCYRDDIALAANILDDDTRKTIIFTSHKSILLFTFFVCLCGQLQPQPAVVHADCRDVRQCRQRRTVCKAFVLERQGQLCAAAHRCGDVCLAACQRIQGVQQLLRVMFVLYHFKPPLHRAYKALPL